MTTNNTIFPENVPADQAIDPVSFNEDLIVLWQRRIDGGRQYVINKGLWVIDFLPGKRDRAMAWREARLAEGQNDFIENEYPDGTYQFVLNKEDSEAMMVVNNLRLSDLKQNYRHAEELTPYFKDTPRYIPAEISNYLLYHTLVELKQDQQKQKDLQLFQDEQLMNAPDYMIVNTNNAEDVALYFDKGGRLRVAYDIHFLYRAAPLLTDLLEFGQETQYAVARYPSGMVMFVIDPELVEVLLKTYKSEKGLASRYNNYDATPTTNLVEEFPKVFETALDLSTQGFVSTLSLFGKQINTEKK